MIQMVYMTAGSQEEAEKLARILVAEGLAGCINVFSGMRSFYVWEGESQESSEWVLVAKTTPEVFPKLRERVLTLHTYACPCILALDVVDGHGPFMDWVSQGVQKA
ncbi:divalent-cation tolerance protein CutA [Desulfobotulus sp.]|jgi:periplasmic divalent cation tolerance protein|uniref:divalent-cation tolerance protein CutA n=1 Tax=Desulfobotulus sp. TaxID=1940337 RepID=UPI002A367330|nr:divalent-cation tolerance protein CutA [Desulfobotulus sp.]MDY0164072.1 divalent-cation tolerance protein CutA [Desulfobotulus sp.]